MEPLLHFAITFTMFALLGIKFRKALPISLLTLLPDLDVLFHIHRSLSHSLVITLVAALPILLLVWRKASIRNMVFLALLAISMHIVLDAFTDYTPILWPLYEQSLWIDIELIAHFGGSIGFTLSFAPLSEPTIFEQFESLDAPLFTGYGLIISIILLAASVYIYMRRVIGAYPQARRP